MAKCDWRRPETYETLRDLNAAGLAWEFLRRNPDYQQDYVRSINAATPIEQPPEVRHWGLSFPCRSHVLSPRASGVLVVLDCAGDCSPCSCPY